MSVTAKARDVWDALAGNQRVRPVNPLIVGIVGILAATLALALVLVIPRVSFSVRTDGYTAELANAAGLTDSDYVYVAGVPAGRVTAVDLAGDHVVVHFRLDGARHLGSTTSAGVKLSTILGKRYLDVSPSGPGDLSDDGVIPLSRTSVPYSLDDIGSSAIETADDLDLGGLQKMLTVVTDTVPQDATLNREALSGVSAASAILAKNADQVTQLLDSSRTLTDVLVGQQDQLTTLLGNADVVMTTLATRREAIHRMVDDLRALIAQASQFLGENTVELDSLLANARKVTDRLDANLANLDALLTMGAPAARALVNATGNGDWADVSAPSAVIADNLLCVVGLITGCS
ncbi:MCE family protein [Rhodococcus sp. NCIMB 12038]|uniref:MCE family protein n=1 Tax=Rhodococcus sp. NCIMB 12038 TaxID=933800 RepID=UPI000B3D2B8C|nr:MCE family protein [Rhodococcus sp. NCIMB 12038]OUS94155.1 virulence factor Mce [Rhodococcus sp. NCIMB 12038]